MDVKKYPNSVLVVDDEPFVLKTTARVLQHLGFSHVKTADTVAGALDLVSSSEPPVGIVLTDLNMPDSDGLELLRRLDEMAYRGDILLFSGEDNQTLTMAESLARARNLSVLGAIEKPVQVERLLKLLSNCKNQDLPTMTSSESIIVAPEMLQQAIQAGEIIPWFQPKIRIADHTPIGVEVLARWPNSSIGPIFPDSFIPVAEEHGLIDELTLSIVEQAIKVDKQWRQQDIDLKIAINLSMDSLHNEGFTERLEDTITRAGGDIACLQLEITESRLMEDLVNTLEILLRLRMKKVRLSIDDFGTGHSNLSQLRDLPFDELKLDRSYVSNSDQDRTRTILESSIEMAKRLDMLIVAEGVETLEEWQRIAQLGCDQVQGYFAAKPMPGEDIPEWMKEWPDICKKLFNT